MNDIWMRNRDRRRLRKARVLMNYAENKWRSEVEKVRKERDMAISEIGKWARRSALEDRWDNE
jgi:hypothetical protein